MRSLLVFLLLISAICTCAAKSATKSVGASTQTLTAQSTLDTQKVDERLRAIENGMSMQGAVASTRLDAQDKRISDLGIAATQQGTQIGAVGTYVAWTSVFIGLVGLVAGLAIYVSTARRAQKEARRAAKTWLSVNAVHLSQEIQGLREEVKKAIDEMDAHRRTVKETATDAIEGIKAAGQVILNSSSVGAVPTSDAAKQAVQSVKFVSDQLRHKPEAEFSPGENYARGLDLYSEKNYQAALVSFEQAVDASPDEESFLNYRIARAVALEKVGRRHEAIDAYRNVIARFGGSDNPSTVKQVTSALLNLGVQLSASGDKSGAIDAYDEIVRRGGRPESVAKALLNKCIALNSIGRSEEAIGCCRQVIESFRAKRIHALVAKAMVLKGILLREAGDRDGALKAFDELIGAYGNKKSPSILEQVARGLNCKAQVFSSAEQADMADDANRQAIELTRDSAEPGMRRQLGAAHNGIGFRKLTEAKRHGLQGDLSKMGECLVAALTHCTKAVSIADEVEGNSGVALGNVGYVQFLLGNAHDAEVSLRRAFELGRERVRDGELDDSQIHRLPQDDQFDALVNRVWASVQGQGSGAD